MHLLKQYTFLPLHHCFWMSALYLDEVSELAEGFLQMSFFGVCREDRQIPSINDRGGNYGLASQLEIAQRQEGPWSHHIFQTGLSEAAETAHLHKVQLPICQIERRRWTCIKDTNRHWEPSSYWPGSVVKRGIFNLEHLWCWWRILSGRLLHTAAGTLGFVESQNQWRPLVGIETTAIPEKPEGYNVNKSNL